jgi:hypothetical protein
MPGPPAKVRLVTRDRSLGKIEPDSDPATLVVSPDSRRFAYVTKRGEKFAVVLDGTIGPEHTGLGKLVFSHDSKRLAYAGEWQGKSVAMIDGKPGNGFISVDAPVFSPDSQRVAYQARDGDEWLVVVDGVEGKRAGESRKAVGFYVRLRRKEKSCMQKETRRWVQKAESDVKGARKLAGTGPQLNDLICFHCQQAAEKYLKAFLQELGLAIPRTHDLGDLLDRLVPHDATLHRFGAAYSFLSSSPSITVIQTKTRRAGKPRRRSAGRSKFASNCATDSA